MKNDMVMALDVGDKRIGVASASLIARLPAPYTVIDRDKHQDVAAEVSRLATLIGADILVIGLPRDMAGRETEQTAKVRQLAAKISSSVGIPIVLQDEAVTSIEAENRLKKRGKAYSKADIDAEAATLILEDYLSTTVESKV